MMLTLTVGEVMQTPVETIGADDSAFAASERLVEQGIGSLVVVEEGVPTGIITDVDITRCVSRGFDARETAVREFMAGPLVTADPDTAIIDAARIMRDNNIKRLPIVEDDKLLGIVTTTDLSNFIPHLSRLKRPFESAAPQKGTNVRPDTAYENDDWEYDYHGHEDEIEIGDTVTFEKTLSEADVEQFAAITGDTNRLHLDESYAKETRFGDRIAHGTLVSGVISAALARLPDLTIYLSQDLSFLGPVSLGDRVRAECSVVEDLGDRKFRITTDVIRGDGETVIDGEAVVLSDPIPQV